MEFVTRLSMEVFMEKESWTNLELTQPVEEGHLVEERMSEKRGFDQFSNKRSDSKTVSEFRHYLD